MQKFETNLPGVLILEPRVFEDARGFFMETYQAQKFAELGVPNEFVQDNHSLSTKGTLRGLHYQLKNPQAKLCRVIRGEVLDVVVDIRPGSPTFGLSTTALLSAQNKRQIFVPVGFAHGFLVLSPEAEFLYKCDAFYTPGDEYGVLWNDPTLAIDWQLEKHGVEEVLLSEKDSAAPRLANVSHEFLPK